MPKHISPHDNKNQPIVNNNDMVPEAFFNDVKLEKTESFTHAAFGYETVCVVVDSVDITVNGEKFSSIGKSVKPFLREA